MSGVGPILEKALAGERISDADALHLSSHATSWRSGAPPTGSAPPHRRRPRHLHRRPQPQLHERLLHGLRLLRLLPALGDRAEGYLLPKPVIFKKIEETLAIGGTGLLMQGGHHPDLGVDYYEDLFSSIKARYPDSPARPLAVGDPARGAPLKLTVWETLTRLRDAGLDSIPGGGAEILVDRVRTIISPKKTTSAEWLAIMRHAQRLGMSTTATMMYGHVETLGERVEHMRKIRDLQDETRGFRRSSPGRSRATATASPRKCPPTPCRPPSTTCSRRRSAASTWTTSTTSSPPG